MPLLTKKFLKDIGVELNDADYESLSKEVEKTLDERVVDEIVDSLDEKQLEELNKLKDKPDQLPEWLASNVPDLKEIIEDEVAIILGDIAESSDKL